MSRDSVAGSVKSNEEIADEMLRVTNGFESVALLPKAHGATVQRH